MPLFALWANVHGGFLYGLVLVGVFVGGDVLELGSGLGSAEGVWGGVWGTGSAGGLRSAGGGRLLYHLGALGVAGVACLVNPVGPGLYAHVLGWFGQRYVIDNTGEYLSPDFHRRSVQIFLFALVLVVFALALSRRRIRWSRLAVVVVGVFFALYSGRNIPLFAVTALPLLALELDGEWRALPWARRLGAGFAAGDRAAIAGIWSGVVAAGLVVLMASGGRVGGRTLVRASFAPDIFPVRAVERARAAHLDGRMFNSFGWGGYLLWAWPEQKVFIDGQTDFYGEKVFRTYQEIAGLQPGWRTKLDSLGISLAVIDTRSALANELEHEPGWRRWYGDSVAVVLRRE